MLLVKTTRLNIIFNKVVTKIKKLEYVMGMGSLKLYYKALSNTKGEKHV